MEAVNIYGVQQESNFFVLSQQKSSVSVPRFPLTTRLASNKVELNRNKTKEIGTKDNQGNQGAVSVLSNRAGCFPKLQEGKVHWPTVLTLTRSLG
jgi:hypothetical protein